MYNRRLRVLKTSVRKMSVVPGGELRWPQGDHRGNIAPLSLAHLLDSMMDLVVVTLSAVAIPLRTTLRIMGTSQPEMITGTKIMLRPLEVVAVDSMTLVPLIAIATTLAHQRFLHQIPWYLDQDRADVPALLA